MKIALNVGCGMDIKASNEEYIWHNIDQHKKYGADMVCKLPGRLPFKKESADLIYCSHVLEDFYREDLFKILEDFHRILKKGGVLHIKVPYWLASWRSIYHVNSFTVQKFRDFTEEKKGYNLAGKWKWIKGNVLLGKAKTKGRYLLKLYVFLVNIIITRKFLQNIYEFSCLRFILPANEIEVLLKKA